jgi:hypothetical protein
MNIRPIQSLSADLITRESFPKREWFYASPMWYYHRARPACTESRLNTDARFYKLIDPDLRPLCRQLNARGIRTTPSCQGHFYQRGHYQKVWDLLQRESRTIVAEGLEVRNAETDELRLFKDPAYKLPWPSFEIFLSKIAAEQGKGYLGMWVNASLGYSLTTRCARLDPSSVALHHALCPEKNGLHLLYFTVDANSPDARAQAWRQLGDCVRDALDSEN